MPIVAVLTLLIQADQARAPLEAIIEHAKRFRIKHEEEQAWVAAARGGLAG